MANSTSQPSPRTPGLEFRQPSSVVSPPDEFFRCETHTLVGVGETPYARDCRERREPDLPD